MAWRPTRYLIDGELDNTEPDKVTGWMRFSGKEERVNFSLIGNFHRDIRGAKIKFTGDAESGNSDGSDYMESFDNNQDGNVGDITAGLPPADYVKYPYIEWYSDANGRVVLELDPEQVEVIGTPIPAIESDPVDRSHQNDLINGFLRDVSKSLSEE